MMKQYSAKWLLVVGVVVAAVLAVAGPTVGVVTHTVEHEGEKAFSQGDPNGVLIDSRGRMVLGYEHESLLADCNDVWVVNAIAVDAGGAVYAATSGEGVIYRFSGGDTGSAEIIYGQDPNSARHVFSLAIDGQGRLLAGTGGEQGKVLRQDGDQWETVFCQEGVHYVWDIAVAEDGALVLGTGPAGKVFVVDGQNGEANELYQANEKNILRIALDGDGNILAGGDEYGLVYRIDRTSGEAVVVYDTERSEISGLIVDKEGNLLISTADTGAAWSGKQKLLLSDGKPGRPTALAEQQAEQQADTVSEESDPAESSEVSQQATPGPEANSAAVNDGSEESEDEATASEDDPAAVDDNDRHEDAGGDESLAMREADENGGGDGKSQQADSEQDEARAGATETISDESQAVQADEDGIPARWQAMQGQGMQAPVPPDKDAMLEAMDEGDEEDEKRGPSRRRRSGENEVILLSPRGYAMTLFSGPVMILDMVQDSDGRLLLASGSHGRLIRLDPETRESVVIFESETSAEMASLALTEQGQVYAGLANPGGVELIEPTLQENGYYLSDVIDAEQVSQWGRMQIDAVVPEMASVAVQTRSGNVSDPKRSGWYDWSKPVTLPANQSTASVEIASPAARFLQYKLLFGSGDGHHSGRVDSVRVAHMIPNLPPYVESVTVKASGNGKTSGKSRPGSQGKPKDATIGLTWSAIDDNGDTLRYDVFIRPEGGVRWVRIAEDLETARLKWDSHTVADGRYAFKVVAKDDASNSPDEAMTGSRVSEPVVVDNSAPEVKELRGLMIGQRIRLTGEVVDGISAVKTVRVAVNSSEEWLTISAADGMYDSMAESIDVTLLPETEGPWWITVEVRDVAGNRGYEHITLE